MSKGMLCVSVALVAMAVGACGAESGESELAVVNGPAAPKDVRAKVSALKPHEGLNFIDSTENLNLYAKYEHGRIVSYELHRVNGDVVPSHLEKKGAACSECGLDDMNQTQCWVVACPSNG